MALVEIALFQNPMPAQIALGRLESEGIEGLLLGAGLASLGLGSMAPIRLMVDQSDRSAAQRILSSSD